MYKKTITYNDYDGKERVEDHYFNLDEGELMEMYMSVPGGYPAMLQRVVASQSEPELFKIFKEIVTKSYGEKSGDGKYFYKEDDDGKPLVRKFLQSKAYSALMMEFMTNTQSFTDFANQIIPADMAKKYAPTNATPSASAN